MAIVDESLGSFAGLPRRQKFLTRARVGWGEKRILGASQGRSATARGGVAEFFSRKISVTVFNLYDLPSKKISLQKIFGFVFSEPHSTNSRSERNCPKSMVFFGGSQRKNWKNLYYFNLGVSLFYNILNLVLSLLYFLL